MTGIPGEAMGLTFNPAFSNNDPIEAAWRMTLAEAIEEVLQAGAETIEALAEGLNTRHAGNRRNQPWTAESLASELQILAA